MEITENPAIQYILVFQIHLRGFRQDIFSLTGNFILFPQIVGKNTGPVIYGVHTESSGFKKVQRQSHQAGSAHASIEPPLPEKAEQIYAEAESNANAQAFERFILQQTGDLRSHGSCRMKLSQKPSGLHCRGVNRINGRQAKYRRPVCHNCKLPRYFRNSG